MIALTIVAVAVTAIAFIFCTVMGIKMIFDDFPGVGLLNIAMGVGNLMLCLGNIMRLVAQNAGAQFVRTNSGYRLCLRCYFNSQRQQATVLDKHISRSSKWWTCYYGIYWNVHQFNIKETNYV